jgi:hypothetical protein
MGSYNGPLSRRSAGLELSKRNPERRIGILLTPLGLAGHPVPDRAHRTMSCAKR